MSIETNCVYDFKLNDQGKDEVKKMKTIFSDFQQAVLGNLKPGRSTSKVKTKLEEALFDAVRSVAEQEENHSEIITY